MLFNSYIFILLFLPVTLFLYYGLNSLKHKAARRCVPALCSKEEAAKGVLIAASLYFYAYFEPGYLLIILASVCFNYGCSKLLVSEKYEQYKKTILAAGILANAGIIFYYKYFNFFLENMNLLLGTEHVLREILMPLGISFFTFQQISYLVDSYRGETKEYCFLDYGLFVTFFPQLVAGPIVLHDEMIPQFRDSVRKKLDHEKFAKGIWWFAIGLGKKVLLADSLGKGVDWGYANVAALGGLDVFVVSLLYCLQIYFDFSGYCDMACGIGAMFGIDLPKNFNSPYKSTSITEFWQRWHMSLSRFLQRYIYFPLGGNRKGYARSLVNIMIVFLVSGIWHGAAWTFVIWGLFHGVGRILHKIFYNGWEKLPKVLRWFVNFLFIDLTWIFFRAESMEQAVSMLGKMFQPWQIKLQSGLLEQFHVLEFTYIEEHIAVLNNFVKAHPQIHLWIILILALGMALIPKNCQEKEFKPTVFTAAVSVVLLVWSVVSFSGISTFLYFNF